MDCPSVPGISRWWQWTLNSYKRSLHRNPFPAQAPTSSAVQGTIRRFARPLPICPHVHNCDRMNTGPRRVWKKCRRSNCWPKLMTQSLPISRKGTDYESELISKALRLFEWNLRANKGRGLHCPRRSKDRLELDPGQAGRLSTSQGQKNRVPKLNIEGLDQVEGRFADTRVGPLASTCWWQGNLRPFFLSLLQSERTPVRRRLFRLISSPDEGHRTPELFRCGANCLSSRGPERSLDHKRRWHGLPEYVYLAVAPLGVGKYVDRDVRQLLGKTACRKFGENKNSRPFMSRDSMTRRA